MEQGIFGLYPLAFVGIMLIIGMIATVMIYQWWDKHKRLAYIKQATDPVTGKPRLLCEFCSPEGSYEEFCDIFKGQAKKIESNSRATFNVTQFIKPKQKEKTELHSIDAYNVLQDHCFPWRWPTGEHTSRQIVVLKTHYLLNDPMPKITYRPDDWTAEKYAKVTAALGKLALDEKALQVMMSDMAGTWKQVETFVEYIKKIPVIFKVLIINIFFTVLTLFATAITLSNISTISQFLRGVGG